MKPSNFVSGFIAVGGLSLVLALGACTANSTTYPLAPSPAPATPVPQPTFAPSSSTQALTAGTPATFPAAGGVGGSWEVLAPGSSIPIGTTVTITLQSATPAGVPALSNTLFYIGIETNNTVSIGSGSVFTSTLPSGVLPPSTPLAIQSYAQPPTNTGWNIQAGPADMPASSSSTLTTFTSTQPYTLTGGTQYWFAVTIGPGSPITVI